MAKYRIMTFDGGGVRGALTATLLERLSARFPTLIETVDLFAGVSTGSFIALALAFGKTPKDLLRLYSEENARFIFTPRYPNLLRPWYDNQHLTTVLATVFPPVLPLKDLKRRVLVLSFRVIGPEGGNWTPVFFDNFPGSTTLDDHVIDVALSSSAAPTYFPSFEDHIDGGVITNNPSIAAIAVAVDKQRGQQNLGDIYLLSFGTGFNPSKITANTEHWGVLQWALNPFSSPEFPLTSVLTDGAAEADVHFSSQLIGDRHFRLNPTLSRPIALDDYQEIPMLIDMANRFDLAPVVDWINRNWF